MGDLPYEIIYKIFNHVDDYTTAKNFLTLDKKFYIYYSKTKQFSLHTLHLLFRDILQFLYDTIEMSELDFRLVTYTYPPNFLKNTIFIYNLIYKTISDLLHINLTDKYVFIHSIITSHPDFILQYIKINIKYNKITLDIPCINQLILYKPRYSYRYIKKQFFLLKKVTEK